MKKYNNYTKDDLTIVICAYKECEYLELCIQSIIQQTLQPKILISTSTPNSYISKLAEKYQITVKVNERGGQIQDYNFALKQVDTKLGMLAHQDDILEKDFVEKSLQMLNCCFDPIISFTNYREIYCDKILKRASIMIRIKNLLSFPLLFSISRKYGWGKRLCQVFGNPITHPTVICVMKKMPEICFREGYYACMDWDLWERLSRQKGSFVYISKVLLFHRMSEDNQTVKLFKSGENFRYNEEMEIFSRFWPKFVAKFIMYFYKQAERFY